MRQTEYFKEKCDRLIKDDQTVSVLFTGVGGQGILLASTVLAAACVSSGYDVKVSEVHGMAQRGGSVIGSVRFAKKVYSPTIEKADFLVSLEMLEALRYKDMLVEDGAMLISRQRICPVSAYTLKSDYPEDIEERIKKNTDNYFLIDAVAIASQLQNLKVANLVLLGGLSALLPLQKSSWQDSIHANVPAKAIDINLDAFEKGRNILMNGG
jgi:indolepyruvate ferredoxin oxidoreductase, beta subunit